jgi:lysine 2,3-aminomutase
MIGRAMHLTGTPTTDCPLSDDEKAYTLAVGGTAIPSFRTLTTDYYRSLAHEDPSDPIRRQFIPTVQELDVFSYETADPLGAEGYTPIPRLIHQYANRVLILTTGTCFVHCRHCFRRAFAGREAGALEEDEIKAILSYLRSHPEVQEVILSGGDPLTLSDKVLKDLMRGIRSRLPKAIIRIGTRAPVVLPSRISKSFVEMLNGFKPVWIVSQWNHPSELTEESERAASALVDRGIPVLNQSVLLRGINDEVAILEELFNGLVRMRVKPYYLFQGDLAKGTSHFRTNLARGISIVTELRERLSGLSMPAFAVDLPGGGGKTLLTPDSIRGERNGFYVLLGKNGELYRYPNENLS